MLSPVSCLLSPVTLWQRQWILSTHDSWHDIQLAYDMSPALGADTPPDCPNYYWSWTLHLVHDHASSQWQWDFLMVDGGLPPLQYFLDGIRYWQNGGGDKPGGQQAADQNARCTKVNVKRCQQQVLYYGSGGQQWVFLIQQAVLWCVDRLWLMSSSHLFSCYYILIKKIELLELNVHFSLLWC